MFRMSTENYEKKKMIEEKKTVSSSKLSVF